MQYLKLFHPRRNTPLPFNPQGMFSQSNYRETAFPHLPLSCPDTGSCFISIHTGHLHIHKHKIGPFPVLLLLYLETPPFFTSVNSKCSEKGRILHVESPILSPWLLVLHSLLYRRQSYADLSARIQSQACPLLFWKNPEHH